MLTGTKSNNYAKKLKEKSKKCITNIQRTHYKLVYS